MIKLQYNHTFVFGSFLPPFVPMHFSSFTLYFRQDRAWLRSFRRQHLISLRRLSRNCDTDKLNALHPKTRGRPKGDVLKYGKQLGSAPPTRNRLEGRCVDGNCWSIFLFRLLFGSGRGSSSALRDVSVVASSAKYFGSHPKIARRANAMSLN